MTMPPLMMRFLKPKVLGALKLPTKVMFWLVSIVAAVVPLLDANCKTPEVSALMFSAVALVVPALTMLAMIYPFKAQASVVR
jgi:hypothetical protein